MSDRIEEILNKYEPLVLKNIEENNMNKIIEFLLDEQVDYIEEILTNYLDIFLINIEEFKERFNNLKIKYGNNLVELIKDDLGILEEL